MYQADKEWKPPISKKQEHELVLTLVKQQDL